MNDYSFSIFNISTFKCQHFSNIVHKYLNNPSRIQRFEVHRKSEPLLADQRKKSGFHPESIGSEPVTTDKLNLV